MIDLAIAILAASGALALSSSLSFTKWILERQSLKRQSSLEPAPQPTPPDPYRTSDHTSGTTHQAPEPPPERPQPTYEERLTKLRAQKKKYAKRWTDSQGEPSREAYKKLQEVETEIAKLEDEQEEIEELKGKTP